MEKEGGTFRQSAATGKRKPGFGPFPFFRLGRDGWKVLPEKEIVARGLREKQGEVWQEYRIGIRKRILFPKSLAS